MTHKYSTKMEELKKKLILDVKNAMDGRTQRWLALEIKMPEDNLSKRMQGTVWFTQEEIATINERLKSNIEYPQVEA